MAHHTLQAGCPAAPLPPGMTLKLEAIDPTADANVTGVTATRWTIYGYDATFNFDALFPDTTPMLQPSQGV